MNYMRLAASAVISAVALFAGEMAFIALMGSRIMAARQAAGLPEFVPQPLLSILETLLTGAFIAWLYVSVRPRYGTGPKTAVVAGVAAWGGLVLLSTIHMIGEGLGLPTSLLLTVAFVVLPVFIAASLVGAWFYKE